MRIDTTTTKAAPTLKSQALSTTHRQELLAAFSKLSPDDLEQRQRATGDLPNRQYITVGATAANGRSATLYVPEHGADSNHASRFYVRIASSGKGTPSLYGPFRLDLSKAPAVPPDVQSKAQQIVEDQIQDVLGDAKDELRGDLTFKPGKNGTVLVSGKVFRDDLWGGASTWKFTGTVDVKKGTLSNVETT